MTATDNALATFALFLIVTHGVTAIALRTIYVSHCDSKQPMSAHQRLQGTISWIGLVTAVLATATVVDPIVNPSHIPIGWMMAFNLAMANVVMITSSIQRQKS